MSARAFLQKRHIGHMLDVVRGAALRFPLAFLAVLVLTVCVVAETHNTAWPAEDRLVRMIWFSAQAAVLALGVQLLGEGHRWQRGKAVLAGLAALAALAATVFVPPHFSALHIFLSAALALFLLFAAFAGRRVTEDAVWLFNYKSALAVIFGGMAALVLCLGLSAILASVKYLFGVNIDGKFFADIWTIGGFFFFPVYVLASLPRVTEDQGAICALPAGISFIANYLMVPMMLAYTGILYAYGLKIVFEWSLPRGNLAYMVTSYGSIGVITHLCVYPMRETGTALLRFFYRRFYVLLAGPLVLLGIGIWARIHDYGLTEPRAAIVLCLVWLAVLSARHVLKPAATHIKHVPAALCVMALVAALGAQKLSVQSQFDRLAAALQRAGVLQNGQAVKVTGEVDFDTRKEISSILDYLRDRRALGLVRDWAEPFRAALLPNKKSRHASGAGIIYDCGRWMEKPCAGRLQTGALMQAWGMEYVYRGQGQPRHENRHHVRLPEDYRSRHRLRHVAPYAYTVDLNIYARDNSHNPYRFYESGEGDNPAALTQISVRLDADAMLTVESDTGAKAVFDLRGLASWAREKRPLSLAADDLPRMTLAPVSGDMAAELRLSFFTAGADAAEETQWHIQNLDGTLLFALPENAAE